MTSIFLQEPFRDFGPLGLSPDTAPPCLVPAQGTTPARLRKQVALLTPRRPGVYGMLDGAGLLHYVGKAKDLRARLLTYFQQGSRREKGGKIIRSTQTIVWEVWPREFSALLRELELIRRWRPRWNVLGQPMRFRHGFLCLGRSPAPYLFLASRVPSTAKASFGPLPYSKHTQAAVRLLNDCFRLRDCPQATEIVFPEQGELFPVERPVGCLRLDLGTCLAPCIGTCTKKEYFTHARQARAFLEGTNPHILETLRRDMEEAARGQLFERAASLRDKVALLEWLLARLDRLRQARATLSLVYPVEGPGEITWWYLINAGRPVRAIPAPRSPRDALDLEQTLERVFLRNDHPSLADSHEHVDSTLLVSSWFRKFPQERKRALTPTEALARCRELSQKAIFP